MKAFLTLLCMLLIPSVSFGQQDRDDPEPTTPRIPEVYVQYHVWFRAGECPSGHGWSHWSWVREDHPCQTVPGAPWLRQISSPGYPLIGPYSGDSVEVLRWHIRLAKAAGIDGFFVSVYSWADPDAFPAFATMLRVAYEEQFKLGIEGWLPDPGGVVPWKDEVMRQLVAFTEQSPYRSAFLQIQGRPAYWFNFNERFMPTGELFEFLDRKNITWLLAGGTNADELVSWNRGLLRSSVQQLVRFHGPGDSGWQFNRDFSRQLGQMNARRVSGLLPLAHGYPGFDESRIAHAPGRGSSRFGRRDDGRTLSELLSESAAAGADAVFVESFNDWNEYTMLEPGSDILEYSNYGQEEVYRGNPYKYLAVIAQFKGLEWNAPPLPCAVLDPLVKTRGVACQ